MTTTLYRGGSIYAADSPRSTAMLVDETAGRVVWIGTDEAAAGLGVPDRTVELAGALVAPAFVDALVDLGALAGASGSTSNIGGDGSDGSDGAVLAAAARAGVLGLHDVPLHGVRAPDSPRSRTSDQLLPEVVAYGAAPVEAISPRALVADAVAAGRRPGVTVEATTDPEVLAGVFVAAVDAGEQLAVTPVDAAASRSLLSAAHLAAVSTGLPRFVAARHRVQGELPTDPADIESMARLGLIAVAEPRSARSRTLAAAGVPLAWGSGAGIRRPHPSPDRKVTDDSFADPWRAVRDASAPERGEEALSVRAAFAAATRGGRRAARSADVGELRPGAAATFVVWEYDGDLVVRTPDARVAAWSTDPRAATPGLPDLDAGTPRCVRSVRDGRVLFDVLLDGRRRGATP